MPNSAIRPTALALLCAVNAGAIGHTAHQRDRVPEPTSIAMRVEPGCSDTRPGVATLRVSWRGGRADLARQRLDISAHKGGFEKGLFVTLDRIERGGRTRRSSPPDLPIRFFRTALALTATSVDVDRGADAARVDLEGVQPGLYYFVRMSTGSARGWTSGPTLSQPIPPCIVEADEDEPRRRR